MRRSLSIHALVSSVLAMSASLAGCYSPDDVGPDDQFNDDGGRDDDDDDDDDGPAENPNDGNADGGNGDGDDDNGDDGTQPPPPPAPQSCPWEGDGECDEPEGTGLCAEGSDPIDCSGDNATTYLDCPCEGDDICVSITGVDGAFCSPPCNGTGSYCPAAGAASAPTVCGLSLDTDPEPTQCVLVCTVDAECPFGASCISLGDASVCLHT